MRSLSPTPGALLPRLKAVAAACLSLGILAGCASDAEHPPAGKLRPAERLNVLLISLDTTRADHLGCYGQSEELTPAIDRLAAEGALFEQCVAPTPLTLPSHASLMTGLEPYVHGVRDNGAFHLDDENLTLAEALLEAGYSTAAEPGSYVLNSEYGLDQGFEAYHDLREGRTQRRADQVAAAAIDRLRAAADSSRPFFLFAHFFDPHQPYDAPAPFAGRHASPYADEIAYTDEHVGALLAELDALGLRERTLVVLVGDHGESLGQHGESTHSFFVYDATTAVPLILRAPGRVAAGRRVRTQVRLIDVAPTILELAGVGGLAGAQGTGLTSMLDGAGPQADLPAYSETLFPLYAFGYSPLRSLRVGGWKYIHAPRSELYHVAEDPGELHDLSGAESDRVDRMRQALIDRISAAAVAGRTAGSRRELDGEELEKLRALGYVGGASTPIPAASELELLDSPGPDPKDRVDVMALSAYALNRKRIGDLEGAEQSLRRLFAISPEGDPELASVHDLLAKILDSTGRHDEAVEHYRAAIVSGRAGGITRTNLGAALVRAGRVEEAVGELETALRQEPVFAATHLNYCAALLMSKRYDEAAGHCRRALEIDPTLIRARLSLGAVLTASGRNDEAMEAYELAIVQDPESAPARRALAELLIEQRRPEAALEQYRRLLRLTPDDPRAQRGTGLAYLQLQRPEQALGPLGRSVELAPTSARGWFSLSAAQAATGRLAEAIESAERARYLANRAGETAFAERIGDRILEYRREGG